MEKSRASTKLEPQQDLPHDISSAQRRKSLTRNTVYNIAGTASPLLVSILTIPLYLGKVGDARYGVIALIWLLFGYFGLFDLGLSRATANRLARPENQSPDQQANLFWTALIINTLLGILGGIILFLVAAPLLNTFTKIPADLTEELISATPWVACLLPLATTSAVFSGVLEAKERFLAINAVGVFGSTIAQLAPVVAVYIYGPSIRVAIVATIFARLTGLLPVAAMALNQISGAGRPRFSYSTARDLFGYGSWITTSNIVSPILVSVDQLLIGAALGVGAVTHYTIPFNLGMKLQILPGATTRAIFPQLSKLSANEARKRAETVTGSLALALAMICVPAILFAEYALTLWLGPEFAEKANLVTKLILVGVWMNGLAQIPYVFLESQGRPDLPAKFHLLELLPFIGILWVALHLFGLPGAALAWAVRVLLDAIFLLWAAKFSIKLIYKISIPAILVILGFSITFGSVLSPTSSAVLALASLIILTIYGYIFDPTARRIIVNTTLARKAAKII